MKKILFVVNPQSGSSDLNTFEQVVRDHFPEEKFHPEITVFTTETAVGAIIQNALERSFDIVVAAGGDGTIAFVANKLIGSKTLLGIIPLGTSNALAKELGIPLDTLQAAHVISTSENSKSIDAMKVGEKCYFIRLSIGLSSIALTRLNNEDKKMFGTLGYLVKGAQILPEVSSITFNLEVDGEKHKVEASDIVVNNAETLLFSNVKLGSQTSVDDGQVEILLFKSQTPIEYLTAIKDILLNEKSGLIESFSTAKNVSIACEPPLPVQADGDLIGETPVNIEVLPNAITIVV